MTLRLAHSPDADDAFMFHGLTSGKVDRGSLEIEEVREDIQTLNRRALEGTYEVSAVSLHVLPKIADRYALLPAGGCFGNGYGPVIVATRPLKPKQILKVVLGVPGKETTAYLLAKLYEKKIAGEGKSGLCVKEIPFDQIMDFLASGKIEAGVLIHEGQLTYAERGFHKVVDLGEWWGKTTNLPLPLGGIVIRRDLDPEVARVLVRILKESIRYGLEHREEALEAALPYARGLDKEKTARFIEMYVNDLTVDMGRKGIKALRTLFVEARQKGLVANAIDFDRLFWREASEPLIDESSSTPPPDDGTSNPSPDPVG